MSAPTSSPFTLPSDPTVESILPLLKSIISIPGTHHSASFLLDAFAEYLRVRHDNARSCNVNDSGQFRLQELNDQIDLATTIMGAPGHECAQIHGCIECRKILVEVPIYRLPGEENIEHQWILNLGAVRLFQCGTGRLMGCASYALSTEEYERMLHNLISKIIRMVGSDCVPVVMRPVLTDELKGYIEPLTRMGKGDSIEFPAVDGGDKPRFRLLGLSNEEIRLRGWGRTGLFGWNHIQD